MVPPRSEQEQLTNIRYQVEYYLSDQNLSQNEFLQFLLHHPRHPNAIPLEIIAANCPMMQHLQALWSGYPYFLQPTMDLDLLRRALENSHLVGVSDDGLFALPQQSEPLVEGSNDAPTPTSYATAPTVASNDSSSRQDEMDERVVSPFPSAEQPWTPAPSSLPMQTYMLAPMGYVISQPPPYAAPTTSHYPQHAPWEWTMQQQPMQQQQPPMQQQQQPPPPMHQPPAFQEPVQFGHSELGYYYPQQEQYGITAMPMQHGMVAELTPPQFPQVPTEIGAPSTKQQEQPRECQPLRRRQNQINRHKSKKNRKPQQRETEVERDNKGTEENRKESASDLFEEHKKKGDTWTAQDNQAEDARPVCEKGKKSTGGKYHRNRPYYKNRIKKENNPPKSSKKDQLFTDGSFPALADPGGGDSPGKSDTTHKTSYADVLKKQKRPKNSVDNGDVGEVQHALDNVTFGEVQW
jgi:hypothetical protein